MRYIKPEVVILELEKDDVIVTSLGNNGTSTEEDSADINSWN